MKTPQDMRAVVKQKQPAPTASPVPDAAAYDEERIPFADVMRTLLKAKPRHKTAPTPKKPKTTKAK